MLRSAILLAVGAFAFGLGSNALSIAQSSSSFEKKNFNYNEWTKGKFSEVVTVTNPGKFIFLAGIGPEREGGMAKSFTRTISWSSAGTLT